jgi:PAS domain S-box-containing protein
VNLLKEENRRLREALEAREAELAACRCEAAERSEELDAQVRRLHDIRSMADAMPLLLAYVDHTERYRFTNRAYERWFGRPVEAIAGRTVADLLGAEAYATIKPRIDAVLCGQTQHFRERLVYRDAGLRDVDILYVPDGRLGGPVRGFFVMVQDMTERMQAQEAVVRSHAFIRQIIDTDPNFVFAKDRQGRFTLVNQAVADCYGTTVEDLIGKTDADFNPNVEEVAFFRRIDLEVMDRRTERCISEERITDATGNVRWLQTVKRPLCDGDGATTQLLGVATDITERKQAEQELARVKDRLALILEAAGEGIYGVDADGRASFINQAGAALFGYRPEELLGRNLHTLLHQTYPDGRPYPEEACPIYGCLRDGVARRGEDQVFWRKDGTPLSVSFTSSPLVEGTRVVGAVVVVQDITERMRQQEALRQSEERFRRAADSSGAVVYDIDVREPGKSLVHGLERVMGIAPEHVQFDLAWWKARLHPDDAPTYLADLEAQLTRGGVMKASFRIRHASGAWLHMESSREVLLDREGRAVRLVGAMVDVTHRVAAEAALRESEERLRLALVAGHMGAWDVDLATERTRWDEKECELLGLSDADAAPSPQAFYGQVHPEDRTMIRQAVQRAIEGTGLMEYEFRVIHPDGEVRWLAARGQVLKDEQGRAVRIVGVNYDVTQRKRTEERLRSFTLELEWRVAERTRELMQSQDRLRALATELNLTEQRERKRLAGDLHDYLAQLLALVRMRMGQLKRQSLSAGQAEMVAEAEKVVNEALTYTRTLVTQLSPPVLHEFGLPVALKWLGQQMVRQELTVEVRQFVPDELTLPEDQAVLLFQSIRELLVNVRKHADTHRALLTIEERSGELIISVHDDGAGSERAITAHSQPTATSSKFGLFSIKERMLAIGGRFEFESAPGKGTTATLRLPLGARAGEQGLSKTALSVAVGTRAAVQKPSEAQRSMRSDSTLHRESHPIRVLLVDDHALVREGLRGLLKQHGDVEVVGEAWDGEEAVAFADRLRPDVIIMDVSMPRLDGMEATRRIKAAFRSIAVVGLSVNSSSQVEQAMRASGADAFLSKEAAGEQVYRAIKETAKRSVE